MNYKKGQVLLITIMLLATIVTVTLAVTLKSTTDTQVSKLEEESQKALAAAEAGIEAALRQGSNIADLSTLNIPGGFSGSAIIATTADSDFVSPLLDQDQQYTLYLSDVNLNVNPITFSNPYTGNLTVYYNSTDSSSCNNIALELTLIHGSAPYTVRRFLADNGNRIQGAGKLAVSFNGSGYGPYENQRFYCQVNLGSIGTYSQAKLLILRSLFSQTKIGFVGNIGIRVQGNTVTSEARSATGVTKRVQLFQSYPQLPAEFFVTSF